MCFPHRRGGDSPGRVGCGVRARRVGKMLRSITHPSLRGPQPWGHLQGSPPGARRHSGVRPSPGSGTLVATIKHTGPFRQVDKEEGCSFEEIPGIQRPPFSSCLAAPKPVQGFRVPTHPKISQTPKSPQIKSMTPLSVLFFNNPSFPSWG